MLSGRSCLARGDGLSEAPVCVCGGCCAGQGVGVVSPRIRVAVGKDLLVQGDGLVSGGPTADMLSEVVAARGQEVSGIGLAQDY